MNLITNRLKIQFPIGGVLAIGLGGLSVLTIVALVLLGVTSTRENTRTLLGRAVDQSLDKIVQRIATELDPVFEQAQLIRNDVSAGRLDPLGEKAAFDRFMLGVLAATPQVTGIGYVSSDNQFTRFARVNNTLTTTYPPARPGVLARSRRIQGLSGPTWDEPFWVRPRKQMVINLHTPLVHKGKSVATMTQVVTVSDLSLTLAKTTEQSESVPFVLYGKNEVLAHPSLIDWKPADDQQGSLPTLATVNDGILREIWNEQRRFDVSNMIAFTGSKGFGLELGDRRYVFAYRTIGHYGTEPWIVGAYISARFARDLRNRIINIFVGGGAILILTTLIALWIGRLVSRPVRRLAFAADQIRRGEMATVEPVPQSHFVELSQAGTAFNEMVMGLQERDRIRSLFGKYVPESIAKRLLIGEETIEPQVTEATILFTDLEGFTAKSEQMRPEEIVEMLNAYFSVLADIVERFGGVITQFQGDAILATFNVPVPDPDHASQAVRAGIAIRDAVATQSFAGHHLNCRIGINTGEVVAGAVGAADRLNYTVHGDAVNLAARLEALNKDYDTDILMSKFTADQTTGFSLKQVDVVPIRGKSEAVTIFTVAADSGATA